MPIGNGVLSLQGNSRGTVQSKPKQAMILRLSAESIAALDSTPNGAKPNIQFVFGEEPGMYIGETYFPMMPPLKEDATHELYLRASTPGKPASNSLKLYANVIGKFTVAREFGTDVGDDIKGRSVAAEKHRQERKLILLDAPPPDLASTKTKKKPPTSNMFMKKVNVSSTTLVAPTNTTTHSSGADSSVRSSRMASPLPSQPKDGSHSLDLRLIHFLASSSSPRSIEEIRKFVGGAERELITALNEVAEHPRGSQHYVLAPQSWFHVRPYDWQGLSDSARTAMARSGRVALQNSGVKSGDPVWEFFKYRPPAIPANVSTASSSSSSSRAAPASEKPEQEVPPKKPAIKTKPKPKPIGKSKVDTPIQMKDEGGNSSKPTEKPNAVPRRLSNAPPAPSNSISDKSITKHSPSPPAPPVRKPPGSGYKSTGRASLPLPASLPPKPQTSPPQISNSNRLAPPVSSRLSPARNQPFVGSPLRSAHSPAPPATRMSELNSARKRQNERDHNERRERDNDRRENDSGWENPGPDRKPRERERGNDRRENDSGREPRTMAIPDRKPREQDRERDGKIRTRDSNDHLKSRELDSVKKEEREQERVKKEDREQEHVKKEDRDQERVKKEDRDQERTRDRGDRDSKDKPSTRPTAAESAKRKIQKYEDDEDYHSSTRKKRKTEPVDSPAISTGSRRSRDEHETDTDHNKSSVKYSAALATQNQQKRRKTEMHDASLSSKADDKKPSRQTPPVKLNASAKKESSSLPTNPIKREIKKESVPPPTMRATPQGTSLKSGGPSTLARASSSSSSARFKRRSSVTYTSSEDEGEIRSSAESALPVVKVDSSEDANNVDYSDHAALRARYDKVYLEHVSIFQKVSMQRVKAQSLLNRIKGKEAAGDSRSSVTDSDGDDGLLDGEELMQMQKRHKTLGDELMKIREVFEEA